MYIYIHIHESFRKQCGNIVTLKKSGYRVQGNCLPHSYKFSVGQNKKKEDKP